jgi:hypothetical protein
MNEALIRNLTTEERMRYCGSDSELEILEKLRET